MNTLKATSVCFLFLAGPAFSEGGCYKKNSSHDPVPDTSAICRFDMLISPLIEDFGFGPYETLSTYQFIEWVDSTASRNGSIGAQAKPLARIQMRYLLSVDESDRARELANANPDYFHGLESLILRDGAKLACSTLDEGERAFLKAGGLLSYRVTVATRQIKSGYDPYLVSVSFDLDTCEAN